MLPAIRLAGLSSATFLASLSAARFSGSSRPSFADDPHLLAVTVVGERFDDVGAGAHVVPVQRLERFRMIQRDLRHELARRQVSPALQFKQKALGADHRASGEAREQVGSGCCHRLDVLWRAPAARPQRRVWRILIIWRYRCCSTTRPFGNRAGLDLGPARSPGLFFSRLWPGPWWSLFRPDPTSPSTSVETGDRRASNRKPDDNARAKCGGRECRQDQNHDHPLTSEKQQSSNPSSSTDRHEMPIRRFKLTVANRPPKLAPCRSWQCASPATLPPGRP
jgi:hypothetical protein